MFSFAALQMVRCASTGLARYTLTGRTAWLLGKHGLSMLVTDDRSVSSSTVGSRLALTVDADDQSYNSSKRLMPAASLQSKMGLLIVRY